MPELEEQVLAALQHAGPDTAKALGARLGVRSHDVMRALKVLQERGQVTAAPRNASEAPSHTNPPVYTLKTPRP